MKVRIVTPSLNQAPYLERCVHSVMQQRGRQLELDYLVLDAESTDGSVETLERLQSEYPRMRLSVGPDSGQADALLAGFSEADADVLGWLNADDVLLPGCLARITEAFSESDADVVYGRAWFIDTEDRVTGAYPVARFDRNYLATFCFLSQPSTFFRRSAYERAGGINATLTYCMDYALWLRLANTGASFSFLPAYLSATRLHDSTKTATGALDFADEVLAVLRMECGSVPPEWQVYRRYRELDAAQSQRPAVVAFAAALVETARRTGEWRRLSTWAVRVLQSHLLAKAAWFGQSPRRLDVSAD